MKASPEHIQHIRERFAAMQTKKDLAELLSEAKEVMYGEKTKPVRLKSLTYYANPAFCKNRYTIFTVKKKSGGDRTINAPIKGLKSILRVLNFVLQCVQEPHEAAMGFVPEKSVIDNAKVHVGNHYVFNLDLKDYFHSFDRQWVKIGFMNEPFYLNGDRYHLAFFLACLCTHPFEVDGQLQVVLPQGSPTSPTITNILCKKLDRRLKGLADRFGAKYTRYADDITFSSPHNIYQEMKRARRNKKGRYNSFRPELQRIIEDMGLTINPSKTRLQKSDYRQEVTGLVVNKKVNVPRRYVKEIRMWLYYWEKYGTEKAEGIFEKDYVKDKGHVKDRVPSMVNALGGKLEYLKMVKGEEDGTYLGLKGRYEAMMAKENHLNEVLNVWEKEGVEQAMKVYNIMQS